MSGGTIDVPSAWRHGDHGIRLSVRVQPRSSRDRVSGLHAGAVKLQVTAPPVEGAANRAVVDLLARWLGVARRHVQVVQGASSRHKTVEIEGDADDLLRRLQAALSE